MTISPSLRDEEVLVISAKTSFITHHLEDTKVPQIIQDFEREEN